MCSEQVLKKCTFVEYLYIDIIKTCSIPYQQKNEGRKTLSNFLWNCKIM